MDPQQPGMPGAWPPPPPGYGYPPPYGDPAARYGPPPPSNLGWAIAALVLFWPLGIPAIIFATRVESQWWRGDAAGAVRSSQQARTFGIWAVVVAVVFFVLALVFFVAVVSSIGCLDGSSC